MPKSATAPISRPPPLKLPEQNFTVKQPRGHFGHLNHDDEGRTSCIAKFSAVLPPSRQFRSSRAAGVSHQLFGTGNDQNASLGQSAAIPTAFGYAVADEPQAALIGRQILNEGGNAADAAAAEGFALSVTLPSRASLGGGGACIVKMPATDGSAQAPVALLFPAGAPTGAASATDHNRPAAIPTLARGLLALQARYGQLPYASVIVPAERLAGGAPISPALEADLKVVGNALLSDPAAAAVFAPSGTLLPAGANLVQPDLAATFEILRTQGVQGFYAGTFAQQLAEAADAAGGDLTVQDLNEATPAIHHAGHLHHRQPLDRLPAHHHPNQPKPTRHRQLHGTG